MKTLLYSFSLIYYLHILAQSRLGVNNIAAFLKFFDKIAFFRLFSKKTLELLSV